MNKKQLIDFLKDNAIIEFSALHETCSIRGNAQAIDPELDREVENELISRLMDGDLAAWFCAKVTASYGGFEGTDYLGCCSYKSLEDFTNEKDGYYTDMVHCAITGLADAILESKKTLDELDLTLTHC
jgi:hypothetical protein